MATQVDAIAQPRARPTPPAIDQEVDCGECATKNADLSRADAKPVGRRVSRMGVVSFVLPCSAQSQSGVPFPGIQRVPARNGGA